MTKTRLEIDGRPGSFFEAEVKGSELHIAVGPLGRNIAAKVRPFPSEAAAKAELERLAGLHRTKGYVDAVEAAPKPKEPTPQELIAEARNRSEWLAARQTQASNPAHWKLVIDDALLAACEAAPDDPAPWHVYADRLAAGDDPRGELALGMLRGLAWEGASALLVFLGRLVTTLEVRHGFVRAAAIGGRDLDALATFLASPFAASLRMLRVGLGELGDWTPALGVIAASPAGRRLRELEFDASDQLVRDPAAYFHEDNRPVDGLSQEETDTYYASVDYNIRRRLEEVSPVRFGRDVPWSSLALERLVIDGPFRGDLGALALPALRELVIRSDRFSRIDDLAAAQCPRLETLEIWFGDQAALDPTRLFDPGVLPALQTLRAFDLDEVTLAMLRDSKLAKRVQLVTTPPDGARAARYAHPQQVQRMPLDLPRGGEPPEVKQS